jgi:hypothetical protein
MHYIHNRLTQLLFLLVLCFDHQSRAAELPRVLVIGDEFWINVVGELKTALKDQALVVHGRVANDLPPTTALVTEQLDQILGKQKWDIIIVNVGLTDLVYRVPGIKSFRALPKHVGGELTVTTADFEKQLQQLVTRLTQTQAKLIWTTIPVIIDDKRDLLLPESELPLNEVIRQTMQQQRIPVIDIHQHLTQQLKTTTAKIKDLHTLFKAIPLHLSILEQVRPLLPRE